MQLFACFLEDCGISCAPRSISRLFAFFLSHVDRSDEAKQHHNSTPSILHVYPSHLLDVLRV